MNEVVEFLQDNPVQYLATIERDNKVKYRPFMFCCEFNGKLFWQSPKRIHLVAIRHQQR